MRKMFLYIIAALSLNNSKTNASEEVYIFSRNYEGCCELGAYMFHQELLNIERRYENVVIRMRKVDLNTKGLENLYGQVCKALAYPQDSTPALQDLQRRLCSETAVLQKE